MLEDVGDTEQGCAMLLTLRSRDWVSRAVQPTLLKDCELFVLTYLVSEMDERHAGDVRIGIDRSALSFFLVVRSLLRWFVIA